MNINMRHFSSLLLACLLLAGTLQAKKVKFMVNMQGQVKSPNGIHVTGDFQTIAGYVGGDWNSASTSMAQSPTDTNLYSVVVDIPAMTKYEYKFVNGDQFYEVEFVPLVSRVGYNFNDNRWIYIDSLAPDTTVVGPLVFSGNAPAGYRGVRFIVDMQNEPSVSPAGVHVAGDFQGWDQTSMEMYSFVANIYEHIGFIDSTVAAAQYAFYNGDAASDVELVSGPCAINLNRAIAVPTDTALATVCFGSCDDCATASVGDQWQPRIAVYPNPATDRAVVRLDNHFGTWQLRVLDQQGRVVLTQAGSGEQAVQIERNGLGAGLYHVQVTDGDGRKSVQKLIFQ